MEIVLIEPEPEANGLKRKAEAGEDGDSKKARL
jgi:hypothetical protein